MKKVFDRSSEFIFKHGIALFICFLLVSAAVGVGLKKLYIEASNESYFIKGDNTLEHYDQFKENFGSDEFVFLLFEVDDAFKKENISVISDLIGELEQVPHVHEVIAVPNAPYVESDEGEAIIVRDFLANNLPESEAELKRLREIAVNHHFYKDRLISRDAKLVGIMINTKIPRGSDNFRFEIRDGIYKIIDSPKYNRYRIHAAGMPINMPTFQTMIQREMKKALVIALVLNLIILFLLFNRSFSGMITPLIIILGCVVITFGTMGLTGTPLSMVSIILMVLLVTVGVGDAVHVVSEFKTNLRGGGNTLESFKESASKVGLPCFLTSLTTAAGFFSLYSSQIKHVRYLGIFAALGTILAFIITFIAASFVLRFAKSRETVITTKKGKTADRWQVFFTGIGSIINKYHKTIFVVFLLFLFIFLFGLTRLNVDSNLRNSFSPQHRIRKDMDYIDSRMGGVISLEVSIYTGESDGVKDPVLLGKIDKLQEEVVTHFDSVFTSFSIVDIIKEVNRVLNNGDVKYSRIPDSRNGVAQLVLLYEMSDAEKVYDFVTFDYSRARINFNMKMVKDSDFRDIIDFIKDYCSGNFGPGIKTTLTGSAYMIRIMKQYLVNTQIQSFCLAFIVISIIMVVFFRPWKLGLLSLIPNITPIVTVLGLCGFLQIPLDATNVMVAAVAIGLIVDSTIHFISRCKKAYGETKSYPDSLLRTLQTSGKAILFTGISLAVSFLAFIFSEFRVISNFGILLIATVILALLADLFLLPSSILLFKPFGKEANEKNRDV